MYEAWEVSNIREQVLLANKALEISPDCADAYVLLAEETARSAGEAAELFAKGVAAGERALGQRVFEEETGRFWGMIETRPYMRARAGLASALWEMGQRREAIDHAWELLRLNPDDNQGTRYVLLNWLLEIDDAKTGELLDQNPDDGAAIWLYGRALHAYRTEGDTGNARKRRAEAKQMNPYVPNYLLGRKKLPLQRPETIGLGDKDEAMVCASDQMVAWRDTPDALAWLDQRTR
ncbi:MAG: hypothetical protein Q7O66_02860 [Dehalococcoidia bacterium]|nr:hypothetical protein [Dehalococcoidia bacterium]